MQIDATNRHVSLSVGEFAAFRPYATPGYGGVSAVWRAQIGTEWHQKIQTESKLEDDRWENEIPIEGTIDWRGWKIALNGRIDQLRRTDASIELREIKTVSEPLPITQEKLLERYHSYPVQLLAYRELLIRKNPKAETSDSQPPPNSGAPAQSASSQFKLDLLFIEIGSGLSQNLRLDAFHDTLLVDQLDTFVDSLEAQQERLQRLRSLTIRSAYQHPRPGQETIQQDLAEAFAKSPVTLLEAPTGYGKTGVAWEYAAKRLATGQEDRLIYLTSKSTGQTEAVERLRALLGASPQSEVTHLKSQIPSTATFWQIRNKQEHCIHTEFQCSSKTCPYLADLDQKWKSAGLQRLYLLSTDEHTIETLHDEGRSTGICPYEIMRAGLGYRDIWIGDYNYLFSPNSTRLLEEQNGFDPARTFLIIDEAHNLASRVASAFTFELSSLALFAAADDLREAQAPRRLQFLFKSLASLVGSEDTYPKNQNSRAKDPLPSYTVEDLRDHLLQLSEFLSAEALPYEDLAPDTVELLFHATAIHAAQKRGELEHVLWAPAPGIVRFECIDASVLIREQLQRYSSILALSATLSPIDSFLEEIGLGTEKTTASPLAVQHLAPPAPWREFAYDVAIDLRVNTRFKSRDSHLATTASTIASATESASPVVVFFPSYAYAEKAHAALQNTHPFIRVALQPRAGGSLAERAAYLEEAIAFNDVLFLILGSSYAEGVDTLGGKAGIAIVVSPALPEMNLIQESKRQRYERQNRNGFERAYLQPGIQKVNQALGRLVRAPGQSVKILLHCERFADPKTKLLLDPLYQSRSYLHEDANLDEWLNKPIVNHTSAPAKF